MTDTIPQELLEMVGKRVSKAGFKNGKHADKQPKPFKSTFLVNTVKGVVPHPQLPGKWAFTFEEDESCKIVNY